MNTQNFNLVDKIVAKYRLSKVLKYLEKDDVILDFGCGSNSFLLSFSKDKIKSGTGIDYDVESRKQGNIEYRQYKFNGKLPFDNGSFNKIFLLAVLEHIEPEAVEKLFLEFKRVLKEGGKIILTTPTPPSKAILEFLAYRLKMISREEIADHKKYYNKLDIEELCQKIGLKLKMYHLFFGGLNSCAVLEKIK